MTGVLEPAFRPLLELFDCGLLSGAVVPWPLPLWLRLEAKASCPATSGSLFFWLCLLSGMLPIHRTRRGKLLDSLFLNAAGAAGMFFAVSFLGTGILWKCSFWAILFFDLGGQLGLRPRYRQ